MMMASTPSHFIVCLAALSSSSAHTAATIGVQVGEKGQMIMRQESSKEKPAEVPAAAALAEVEEDGRPHKGDRRDAAEAFETPQKIDDSLLGNWSPRMPAFVEEYPWFYAAAFVGGAFAFMFLVCFYVQYEDSKLQERHLAEKKTAMRRAAASAAMGVPRSGDSYVPASPAIRKAAEDFAHAASRPQHLMRDQMASPKAKAAAAGKDGMSIEKITNVVGNFTGMLAGENVSTASGASTPNSQPSSQHSVAHSGYSRQSRNSAICNGSVLVARVNEVIFASSSSWQEIGTLAAGQQVIAAGPPEVADAYTMVPIKPRGAVDLKTLVVQEY